MALERRRMTRAQAEAAQIDVGLRQYMLGVYNHMTIGLAITGLVALGAHFAAVQDGILTPFGQAIYLSPLKWVIMLAPIGMVFLFAARLHAMRASTAQVVFWIYAAPDGTVAVQHLPDLYRREHHAGVLHRGGHVRRDEPVRLHHQA